MVLVDGLAGEAVTTVALVVDGWCRRDGDARSGTGEEYREIVAGFP